MKVGRESRKQQPRRKSRSKFSAAIIIALEQPLNSSTLPPSQNPPHMTFIWHPFPKRWQTIQIKKHLSSSTREETLSSFFLQTPLTRTLPNKLTLEPYAGDSCARLDFEHCLQLIMFSFFLSFQNIITYLLGILVLRLRRRRWGKLSQHLVRSRKSIFTFHIFSYIVWNGILKCLGGWESVSGRGVNRIQDHAWS